MQKVEIETNKMTSVQKNFFFRIKYVLLPSIVICLQIESPFEPDTWGTLVSLPQKTKQCKMLKPPGKLQD